MPREPFREAHFTMPVCRCIDDAKDRSSRFNRNVARSAKEVAAMGNIYPDNFKAMWNGIDPEIPRQLIVCGNLGFARFSAPRASQDFNPTVAGHPPTGALQS